MHAFAVWQQPGFGVTLEALPLMLSLACLYVTPAGLLLGAVLMAFGATRRFWVTRWLGFASLGVAVVFALGPVMLMAQLGFLTAKVKVDLAARTHKLTEDQAFGGVLYPAGSTILLAEGKDVAEAGTLSRPTRVQGLLIEGDFKQDLLEGQTTRALEGRLAVPARVNGLPCARGDFSIEEQAVRCRLSEDSTIDGARLAQSTFVLMNRNDVRSAWYLSYGVLAGPETMFDVVWPRGSIIQLGGLKLADVAHPAGKLLGIQVICLPAGADLTLRGAAVRGPVAVGFTGDKIDVRGRCMQGPAGENEPGNEPLGGVVGANGKLIRYGSQENAAAPWVPDEAGENN